MPRSTAIKPARSGRATLSNGEEVSGALGRAGQWTERGLRQTLGIERRIVSACHSISLGFDMVRSAARPSTPGAHLLFRAVARPGFLSDACFPVGNTMRGTVHLCR